MSKKSGKHTPVVISVCYTPADNWLRLKVICDLTVIHNSTGELHTRVNKDKSKAKMLLPVRLTSEIGTGPPNGKESLHFYRQTLADIYRDRHLSQRGLRLHFNPVLSPVHPDMLTLSARDFLFFIFFLILCLCCENSWLPKLFWAAVLGLRL